MIRNSSLAVNRQNKSDGTYSRTTDIIIEAIHTKGAATRREIEMITGLRSNQVSGRIKELLNRGVLHEEGIPVKCPITGNIVKRVYVCEATELTPIQYHKCDTGQLEIIF